MADRREIRQNNNMMNTFQYDDRCIFRCQAASSKRPIALRLFPYIKFGS